MQELEFTENVLLTIAGWLLVSLAAADMFLTARLGLARRGSASFSDFKRGSAFRLLRFLMRLGLKQRLNIAVPVVQVLRWSAMFILGFAFLYLAAQPAAFSIGGLSTGRQLSDAIILSLGVSSLVALDTSLLDGPAMLLIANVQFYLSFAFYLFTFLYAVLLKQRSRKLSVRLFDQDRFSTPESLAGHLTDDYMANDVLLILQEWERWALDMRRVIRAHPQIACDPVSPGEVPWPGALARILDTSELLKTGSRSAVDRQADWTWLACQKLLLEAADMFFYLQDELAGNDNGPFGRPEDPLVFVRQKNMGARL